jgi:hypothetical protein
LSLSSRAKSENPLFHSLPRQASWRWVHFLLRKPLQFLSQLDLYFHRGFVCKCHDLCKELVWNMMHLVGLLKKQFLWWPLLMVHTIFFRFGRRCWYGLNDEMMRYVMWYWIFWMLRVLDFILCASNTFFKRRLCNLPLFSSIFFISSLQTYPWG